MKKELSNPRINSCRCCCHYENCNPTFVPECVNLNLNQSQMIPEKRENNINTNLSFNYNYHSPLFNPKKPNEFDEIKKEIEKNNLNDNKKYDIRERAKAVKDKINAIFLLKKMNKNKLSKDDINYNLYSGKKYTFFDNLKFNKKEKETIFRKKMEREFVVENPHLKRLLSSVPKHEKNKSGKRQIDEKEKYVFTNGIFRMKSFDSKYIKRFNGGASMVMPPNDLNKLNFIVRRNL